MQRSAAPIAWFDLETTGLGHFHVIRIVEVAVVQTHGDTLTETCRYTTLVNPEKDIDAGASKNAHGIYKRDVEGKPVFAQIAAKLYHLMHNHVWAGHNVRRFDIPLLEAEFARAKHPMPKCLGVIDTLEISQQHLRGRHGLRNCKLEGLGDYFQLFAPGRRQTHRAMDDVELTIKVATRAGAVLYLESTFDFIQPVLEQPAPPTPQREGKEEDKEEAVMRQQQGLDDSLVGELLRNPSVKRHTTRPDQCQGNTRSGSRCEKRSIHESVGLCTVHAGMELKCIVMARQSDAKGTK